MWVLVVFHVLILFGHPACAGKKEEVRVVALGRKAEAQASGSCSVSGSAGSSAQASSAQASCSEPDPEPPQKKQRFKQVLEPPQLSPLAEALAAAEPPMWVTPAEAQWIQNRHTVVETDDRDEGPDRVIIKECEPAKLDEEIPSSQEWFSNMDDEPHPDEKPNVDSPVSKPKSGRRHPESDKGKSSFVSKISPVVKPKPGQKKPVQKTGKSAAS